MIVAIDAPNELVTVAVPCAACVGGLSPGAEVRPWTRDSGVAFSLHRGYAATKGTQPMYSWHVMYTCEDNSNVHRVLHQATRNAAANVEPALVNGPCGRNILSAAGADCGPGTQVRAFMPAQGFENCGNATLVAARVVPSPLGIGASSASVPSLDLSAATFLELKFAAFGKCAALYAPHRDNLHCLCVARRPGVPASAPLQHLASTPWAWRRYWGALGVAQVLGGPGRGAGTGGPWAWRRYWGALGVMACWRGAAAMNTC